MFFESGVCFILLSLLFCCVFLYDFCSVNNLFDPDGGCFFTNYDRHERERDMREVEEERRMREMSEEENDKAQSETEGENRDISTKEPDTESVKGHQVYKSTMQGIRETLVKPMKVEINLDISPKEVDVSEVKTEKVSEVKVGERKSSWKPRKRLQTKKTELRRKE